MWPDDIISYHPLSELQPVIFLEYYFPGQLSIRDSPEAVVRMEIIQTQT